MKELKVLRARSNNYWLEDTKDNKKYNFDMYFYGVDFNVEMGDIIVVNENLLDKNYVEYSEEYYFGPIEEVYGRKIESMIDTDLITIKKGHKNIYLKRFYG